MAEKRSSFVIFMNTTPDGAEETYSVVGTGVTDLTVAYNPQTSSEQFINQDSANSEVTGYQPNAPVTLQVNKGEPVYEYVNELRLKRAAYGDAYTDILLVDAFDSVQTRYAAEKQPVTIQIDTYGGAAADPLSIGFTINFRGNGETGTFDKDTKKFTKGTGTQTFSAEVKKIEKTK